MDPSEPIPDDVIADIISYLSPQAGDTQTLRACAVVSRSFLPPSQLALFSHITLDGPLTTKALHNLFSRAPHIPPLIHHIRITADPYGRLTQQAWFQGEEDPHLSLILQRLTNLNVSCFTVGWGSTMTIQWKNLSFATQSSLCDLVTKSPGLHTLNISQVVGLPYSFLGHLGSVKYLSVRNSMIFNDLTSPTSSNSSPPSKLESLHLSFQRPGGITQIYTPTRQPPENPFLKTIALRRLSICTTFSSTHILLMFEEVLKSAQNSLEEFVWKYYTKREHDAGMSSVLLFEPSCSLIFEPHYYLLFHFIRMWCSPLFLAPGFTKILASLANIRSLVFVVSHHNLRVESLPSITGILDEIARQNTSKQKRLDSLTFCLDFYGYSMDWRSPAIAFFGYKDALARLDEVLSGPGMGQTLVRHLIILMKPGCPFPGMRVAPPSFSHIPTPTANPPDFEEPRLDNPNAFFKSLMETRFPLLRAHGGSLETRFCDGVDFEVGMGDSGLLDGSVEGHLPGWAWAWA